jgi:hypothetical protein
MPKDVKWCGSCGEGTVKGERPDCKKCGSGTWVTAKPAAKPARATAGGMPTARDTEITPNPLSRGEINPLHPDERATPRASGGGEGGGRESGRRGLLKMKKALADTGYGGLMQQVGINIDSSSGDLNGVRSWVEHYGRRGCCAAQALTPAQMAEEKARRRQRRASFDARRGEEVSCSAVSGSASNSAANDGARSLGIGSTVQGADAPRRSPSPIS